MKRGWIWPVTAGGSCRLPPGVCGDLVRACVQADLFPQGASWLYAWNQFEILLPRALGPERAVDPAGWERLSLFSPRAELRLAGDGCTFFAWLLSEDARARDVLRSGDNGAFQFGVAEAFLVRPVTRVLAGRRHGDAWREIRFPRELDYQPGLEPDGERVVVKAYEYLEFTDAATDDGATCSTCALPLRLATVRYAFLASGRPPEVIPYGQC